MADKYFFGHESLEDAFKKVDELAKYLKPKEIDDIKYKVEYLEGSMYLTDTMKQDFLRSTDLEKLGIAMRFSTKDLYKALLKSVTSTIKEEVLHAAQGQYPIKKFINALDEVYNSILAKVRSGDYILNKDTFDKLV